MVSMRYWLIIICIILLCFTACSSGKAGETCSYGQFRYNGVCITPLKPTGSDCKWKTI
ncbi:hypothetical protein JXA85_08070 [Candidatus Woesearchaeota archaeon]|nr:hypothetical protein [Candidatus Woesearchaeota archaeon]